MKSTASLLLLVLGCLQGGLAMAADRVRIYSSGIEQEQIVRDIARHIARAADIEFDIRTTAGPPESILRIYETGNLQLALLQSDVEDAYQRAASRDKPDAHELIEHLRVLAPLHEEEIHFIVRRDSSMQSFQDLIKARINLGPLRSGTALTASNIYRLMFDAALPDTQASFLTHEEALLKLITEQSLDAVAIVAPRPVKLLANMKPEARQFVKLLKFDASHPGSEAVQLIYKAATAAAIHYPNLLETDQPILTVQVLLAAAGYGKKSDATLSRFAASWCKNLDRLKAAEISRWGSADLSLPRLTMGWRYARSFARELQACLYGHRPLAAPCTQVDRSLGWCE